jgi:hypothetical protein
MEAKITKRKAKRAAEKLELDSDAWPRFEQFIKGVAKAGAAAPRNAAAALLKAAEDAR